MDSQQEPINKHVIRTHREYSMGKLEEEIFLAWFEGIVTRNGFAVIRQVKIFAPPAEYPAVLQQIHIHIIKMTSQNYKNSTSTHHQSFPWLVLDGNNC
jgi:hypothetical protein